MFQAVVLLTIMLTKNTASGQAPAGCVCRSPPDLSIAGILTVLITDAFAPVIADANNIIGDASVVLSDAVDADAHLNAAIGDTDNLNAALAANDPSGAAAAGAALSVDLNAVGSDLNNAITVGTDLLTAGTGLLGDTVGGLSNPTVAAALGALLSGDLTGAINALNLSVPLCLTGGCAAGLNPYCDGLGDTADINNGDGNVYYNYNDSTSAGIAACGCPGQGSSGVSISNGTVYLSSNCSDFGTGANTDPATAAAATACCNYCCTVDTSGTTTEATASSSCDLSSVVTALSQLLVVPLPPAAQAAVQNLLLSLLPCLGALTG